MAVNVRIKQKSLLKKKISIEEIIKLTNLSYGICDENYRLIPDEIGEHTLIYDENKLARGIDISQDNNEIILILSLPTTKKEIKLFYNVIDKICTHLKVETYIREEEEVSTKDNDKLIKFDEEASIKGLEDIKEKLSKENCKRFELFGIYNPISIGQKEINEIGNNLENLEKYFHEIQSLRAYYAAPRIYRIKDKLIGIYVVGKEVTSIVPTKPYVILNQIEGIEDWYIMIKEGKIIKYEDFINNISKKDYYDQNHVITYLTEEEVEGLVEKYQVEI